MDNIIKSEYELLINELVVGRNAERNRQILTEVYILGYPYEQVAEHYELSTSQIKNIVRKFKSLCKGHKR